MSEIGGTSRTAGTGMLATDAGGRLVLRRVVVRVVSGTDRGSERVLESGTLIVGSSPDAELVLHDPTVSRFHAELALVAEGVRVRDLQSTNGTFLGASRIEGAVVAAPAELRFGRTRVELLAADVPAPEVPSERTRFGRLVGASPAMRRLFGVLERIAASDSPVLLEGEPGVGKTEAALAVHEASPRARGPCVTIDLGAALSPGAVERAFTSALGGTIVLDRVDEAPSAVAGEAVGALERRERGEIDVRPIATSRSDARARVESGAMRRDLFFHLASVRIVVPPLRDRLEDLPRIVRDVAESLGYPGIAIDAGELAPLRARDFPGNVRELRRVIEQTLLLGGPHVSSGTDTHPGLTEEITKLPFKEAKERLLDAFEKQYVADLLERHDGNVSRAAAAAGLDRNHLARLAKKHDLR